MKVADPIADRKLQRNSKKKTDYFSTDHLKSDLKKRAVRGGGASLVARTTDFILQLGGTVLLARILSPEDFGIVAMVTTVTGFFLIFKDLGLTEATIQSEHINHNQVSTLFWINFGFSILVAVCVSACAPIISHFYHESRLTMITVISSTSFVFAGLTTQHTALLRRGMFFSHIAIIEICAAIGSTLFTILIALNGAGYWALVARPLIHSLMIGIGAWIFCGWRPGLPIRDAQVKGLIAFGANTLGFFTLNYFARNLDKALVGWRTGAGTLGLYSRAYYLFIVPINQLCIPLHGVAVTTLTKLRNDPERFKKYYMKALTAVSFIGMPLSTCLAANGHDLIMLLLGPQWESATEFFNIFGLSAGIQIIYGTTSWLHVALGRTDRWLRWGIFGTIVTVISFLIGIIFGATGVAVGYTFSLYLLAIPAILYAGKPVNLSIGFLVSGTWRYYAAAAGAGVVNWYISKMLSLDTLLLKLSISFTAFTAIYTVLLVVLYRGSSPLREFYDILKTMIPSMRRSTPE